MELQHNVVGDIFQRVKDGKKTLQSDSVQKKKRKTLTSELDLTRLFQNKTILTPITLIKPYLNETKQNKKEQTQLNSNRGSRVVFLSMDE